MGRALSIPLPVPSQHPGCRQGRFWGGSLVCSPDLLGLRWRWGYIHRAVLAGAALASLALLRGRGSLSNVFVLLLLHLLDDLPDLALCSLPGGARTRVRVGTASGRVPTRTPAQQHLAAQHHLNFNYRTSTYNP